MSWKDEALELQSRGYNHIQICDKLYDEIDAPNRDAALHRIKRFLGTIGQVDKVNIAENLDPIKFNRKWCGNIRLKFGLIGDTHINNKCTQLTYLHDFYEKCKLENVTVVYHTGDIDDGEQMRIGHQYECYNQGVDEHVEEIIKNYPKYTSITTYFITGNHDASIYKRCGVDIGKLISNDRSDMNYLGRDCAVINLTPNCKLELRHPWDGTTYALSYKTQKMIDSMSEDEKPDILAIGHYHKSEQLFYGGVHAFQTGTFCAQTPFMKGKGISAAMGGWICEVELDVDGKLNSIKSQFIPYYKPIDEDYKNFR